MSSYMSKDQGNFGFLVHDPFKEWPCDVYLHQVTCKCEETVSVAVVQNIPFSNCLKKHLMQV